MTGLPNSAWPSGLLGGQGPFLGCGRFRDAVLDHELMSEFVDAGVPFGCEAFVATVVVDEFDDVEATDEDELLLCSVFRGTNMPLTSSGFIEFRLCPPLTFHPGRLSCWKLGGLATAVMRESRPWLGKDRMTEGVDAVEGTGNDAGRRLSML